MIHGFYINLDHRTDRRSHIEQQFADISGRPEKFCAFHFHDVFTARVVDIMPHPGTDPAIVTLLMDFAKRLNQVPVLVKKESPGYIFN
ncbi:MAG: 3-hydroxyacyl-CoA dehydrogenase NAD-binding domain-containing protein, partial [Dolichospermum sp.]